MTIEARPSKPYHEKKASRAKRHQTTPAAEITTGIKEQLGDNLSYLKEAYGLTVDTSEHGPKDNIDISFDKISCMEACESTQLLVDEISKYPRAFIENCGVISIRLVKNLRNRGQRANGVSDYRGNLYLTYPDCGSEEVAPETGFRFTVHHELFHFSDDNSKHGLKYRSNNRMLRWLYEPSWHTLNSSPYVGKGAENGDEHPDYVSPYSMTDEFEDRADTAALLMLYSKVAWQRTNTSDVFAQKVQTIVYAMIKRSAGKMGTRYFNDLMNDEVRKGYWDTEN